MQSNPKMATEVAIERHANALAALLREVGKLRAIRPPKEADAADFYHDDTPSLPQDGPASEY